jgi:hypothetical protein
MFFGGILQPYPISSTTGPFGYKTNSNINDPKKSQEFLEQQKKASQMEYNIVKSQDAGTWKILAGKGNTIIPALP